ncbi:hypothetical protein B7494_g688 [Chlorociboria aeruginascens]|nr:hypothetical protein B7494_g688 [Chlorociboria aeruginascens]
MPENQPPLAHEDSIDSQDPNLNPDKTKQKSRRPANTAFRQQRLKAWQPILTPKTVLPLFFAIGIIFAPIGGLLLYASAQVQELTLDYTNCATQAPNYPDTGTMPSSLVSTTFKTNINTGLDGSVAKWQKQTVQITYDGTEVPTTRCTLNFTIPQDMKPPVLFYYRLTNFYQNHRRYAKSFDSDQLSGKAVSASTIHSGDCTPITTADVNGKSKPYYPCGLAANSLFNDTFYNPILLNLDKEAQEDSPGATNSTYNMTQNGIAWASDRDLYGQTKYNWSEVLVPPNWVLRYPNNYSDSYHPDLVNDEPFQVWMRLAGLPTFSKLAQRNDNETMSSGDYTVNVDLHFPVTEYGGTKAIIISTRTVVGGRNPFLGIAYVVVGGICIVLGALFTVTHLIKPRKLGDHTYLSWNNDQRATATTSGREVLPGEGA